MAARTMIYLEREELEALKERARAERISLTELIRRLVRAYLRHHTGRAPSPAAFERLVGIGASGNAEVGDRHDRVLAEALSDEHLR